MQATNHRRWWRRQGRDELRSLLVREWDPIAIQEFAKASDEYDAYIPAIARMLARGAGAERLAAHLARMERERMGLATAAAERRGVAERLVQWYADAPARWDASAT